MSHFEETVKGSVTLIGAGAGDPELLTLKAVRELALATVIFVDDLVSEAVLAYANPKARIIPVGKRGGCPSTSQAFIEQSMIEQARQGQRVVRLKGGDPMIFGRAGEEMQALRAAGIPYSVVNGVTAALAAATSLGVSLTHRQQAQGVVFITGHKAHAGEAVDWVGLGAMITAFKLTLVIYMGAKYAQDIQNGLLVHCDPATSIAVIERASTPDERCCIATLGELSAALTEHGLRSPLVIVVGEVTRWAKAA